MEGFRCRKRLTRPGSKLWPAKKGQHQTKPTERISPRIVISFVETLEKADQYFGLKYHLAVQDETLRNWFVRDDIAAEIQNDERFNKLDKEEIQHAIDTLNGELHFERIRQNTPSFFMNDRKLDWDGKEVITSSNSDLSKDVDEAAILEKFPSLNLDSNVHEVDKYVMSDPIFTLVLQALLKDRTLDWEPEVELKTLKEVYPFYYYDFFIAEEQKYKANTVTFTYDECDVSAKDIKSSVSNGEILSVSISRLDSHSQMAHVTFRDLTTATNALSLAAQGQLKMAGRPVSVIPTTYNKVPRGLSACKPEHVKAAMSAVEKVEKELLSEARRKYSVLVEKLNGSKVHGKAKKRKTEPELPDDVMFE